MDLADIPAAAAFLGGADASAESATGDASGAASADAASSSVPFLDSADRRNAMAMDSNTTTSAAAAAALIGSAPFYHTTASSVAGNNDDTAAMAQHYYTQNLANFAGFMPMAYGFPMYPVPGGYLGSSSGLPPPSSNIYDMDATALQNQIAAQFSQATPEQQTNYYESVRHQLDTAASGLNEDQKQALLRYDPTLSFTMKPLNLAATIDDFDGVTKVTPSTRGAVKRPRTSSGIAPSTTTTSAAGAAAGAGAAGTKKPKKNKASSSSSEPPVADASDQLMGGGTLLNEESPDSSASATTTPRPTPRGRPPKGGAAAAAARAAAKGAKGGGAAAGGVQLTPSGKKKSMTPQAEEMRARKAKMTWPKGTFIIRLQDVKARGGREHIWLVDNHQLLQRYNNETGCVRADGSRVYHKTDRYTGWLCHEGLHYFPLFDLKHVMRQDGDTVTVMFPSEDELQQAIDYQEQETKRRAELKVEDAPLIRPLPPSIRNTPLLFKQQQQLQRAQSTPSETSMAMGSASREGQMPSSMRYKSEPMLMGSASREDQMTSSSMEWKGENSMMMTYKPDQMMSSMMMREDEDPMMMPSSLKRRRSDPMMMMTSPTKGREGRMMEGEERGGGMMMMDQLQQRSSMTNWHSSSARDSCSASDLPSTSRGGGGGSHFGNEMPLLSRQDYWEEQAGCSSRHAHPMDDLMGGGGGGGMLMIDEEVERGGSSIQGEFKQEEPDYAEFDDLNDPYRGML